MISQRSMVLASLGADRHPDTYLQHRVVRGPNAEPASSDVESHPRVQARRPEETGSDGRGAAPAPTQCRNCGRQHGTMTTDTVLSTGYEAKSTWTGDLCPGCVWDLECEQANAPVVRQIPGSRRAS